MFADFKLPMFISMHAKTISLIFIKLIQISFNSLAIFRSLRIFQTHRTQTLFDRIFSWFCFLTWNIPFVSDFFLFSVHFIRSQAPWKQCQEILKFETNKTNISWCCTHIKTKIKWVKRNKMNHNDIDLFFVSFRTWFYIFSSSFFLFFLFFFELRSFCCLLVPIFVVLLNITMYDNFSRSDPHNGSSETEVQMETTQLYLLWH